MLAKHTHGMWRGHGNGREPEEVQPLSPVNLGLQLIKNQNGSESDSLLGEEQS